MPPATRPPNKPVGVEAVEGRGSVEGNAVSDTRSGLGAGQGVSTNLAGVRAKARDRQVRFTALLHHVTVERLEFAYRALRPNAAAGVDGVTWDEYGQNLQANLADLHARVMRGAFRAVPVRRVFIPKPDGRLRPLGVTSLEDKIVQRALVEVLNAIYERDFLGFSYGFRPGAVAPRARAQTPSAQAPRRSPGTAPDRPPARPPAHTRSSQLTTTEITRSHTTAKPSRPPRNREGATGVGRDTGCATSSRSPSPGGSCRPTGWLSPRWHTPCWPSMSSADRLVPKQRVV